MEENFKHCTKTMLHLRMWLDTHPYPGQASVAGLPRAVIMPYHESCNGCNPVLGTPD